MSQFIASNHSQRTARDSMDFDIQGPLKTWLIRGKCLTQTAVQLGIAGFPNTVANMHLREINVIPPEAEEQLLTPSIDMVNARAFFLLLGVAVIKHDAIARFERTFI